MKSLLDSESWPISHYCVQTLSRQLVQMQVALCGQRNFPHSQYLRKAHSKLTKVFLTEKNYPAYQLLPPLQVYSCSKHPQPCDKEIWGILGGPHTYMNFTLLHRQNIKTFCNITILQSLKDHLQIYQVLVHLPVKKHLHFCPAHTNTWAGFCRITCSQAEMLNTQLQYFPIFADKK